MRRVDPGVPPGPLVDAGGVGVVERQAVAQFYADPHRVGQYSFAAYRDREVKARLLDDFRAKCGYCESRVAVVSYGDVEHYRPKAAWIAADGARGATGYHWLASEWTNLLLACSQCNSVSRVILADGTETPAGKGNHFPLADETARASAPGDEHAEQPLLLSPRDQDVERHLEYGPHGIVDPAVVHGVPSARGAETIKILGLMRRELVSARAARLRTLEGYSKRYLRDVAAMERSPGNLLEEERVREAMEDFRDALGCTTEYLALARQYVAHHHPELSGLNPCAITCTCPS